ncbi:MAG TPA: hypothetical protein VHM91_25155 [Verrucomicrobiales bacterium]|nr:hypothetical protein [Verrucomicrobiales bacterium]
MNPATRLRRITLGTLLSALLITGGVCWRNLSTDEAGAVHSSRRKSILLPQADASSLPPAESAKAVASAHYRACLLLRVLPLPLPALSTRTLDGGINELRSSAVLTAACETLHLSSRWSMDAGSALAKLSAATQVSVSSESPAMGTLLVSSPDREEASELADAIVSAFKATLEQTESDQTSRLAGPVYKKVKALTESVESARNQMLECMNSRQIVDYAFLDKLNGKPGVIQPELDAALEPEIKLAWFRHQLETLQSLPAEGAPAYLASAVLPFQDPATRLCQSWQDVAATAAAFSNASDPSLSGVFDYKRDETTAAVAACRERLQQWITQTDQSLPEEDSRGALPAVSGKAGQEEYRRLKQRYENEVESLRTLLENAGRLFGSDAPMYVPPVLVLKKSVERILR